MNQTNPFHGVGGSYIQHEDGTVEQVEAPTQDHPEGNAARDADGNKIPIPAPDQLSEGASQ